jgi:magnesium-protoporphyrin O-methyltransferase
VAPCCSSGAYGDFFDEKLARRDAKRYRKRGLSGASQRLVELVAERGVQGATLLEIGGGIGALQLELLRRGARRAVNLELSPSYEASARELLREAGLEERVERRVVDIAEEPEAVEATDVVLLHRVVCCYPDYERLLGAAASRSLRLLVFSFPPDNALARLVIAILNLYPRVRGVDFRSYVHPRRAMLDVLERHGLRRVFEEQAGVWRIAVLERA